MPFKHGDFALYFDGQIEEMAVVDEALDDNQYAVRFLDSEDVFTTSVSNLTQGA